MYFVRWVATFTSGVWARLAVLALSRPRAITRNLLRLDNAKRTSEVSAMFNNLVNWGDVVGAYRAIRGGYLLPIIARIRPGRKQHVAAAWKVKKKSATGWWEIPAVVARWNRLISGDPDKDFCAYVGEKYLSARKGLVGISLGSGTGQKVLRWQQVADFARLTGYDLSESRVAAAQTLANERGLNDVVRFEVADIYDLPWEPESLDIVIVEQSLHHFSNLEILLKNINRALRPEGLFLMNEYVGPNRFQWSDHQLQAANALLRLLPKSYRARDVDGRAQKKVYRPSRLQMIIRDPSEAIESETILPLIRQELSLLEMRSYRGALLNLALNGIWSNFRNENAQTKRLLEMCFSVEDALAEVAHVDDNFVVAICHKQKKL